MFRLLLLLAVAQAAFVPFPIDLTDQPPAAITRGQFIPLPNTNASLYNGCSGSTPLSDSKLILRGSPGSEYWDLSVTFKHTRGDTLCFETGSKFIRISIPAVGADVHTKAVKISSERAAYVGTYLQHYWNPTEDGLVDMIAQSVAMSNNRWLMYAQHITHYDLYARWDYGCDYIFSNRGESVYILQTQPNLRSQISYDVNVQNLDDKNWKNWTIYGSTEGAIPDAGYLQIKDLKVELPLHPINTDNHFIIPGRELRKSSAYRDSIYFGNDGVNKASEFDAHKAFWIDFPYQYELYRKDPSLLIKRTSEKRSIPQDPYNLELTFDRGRNSGLITDPYPDLKIDVKDAGDSILESLVKAPNTFTYTNGYPTVTNLKNSDSDGKMIVYSTFSLSEEIKKSVVMSGVIKSFTCAVIHRNTIIVNDTFIHCIARHIPVPGSIIFTLFTNTSIEWRDTVPILSSETEWEIPISIVSDEPIRSWVCSIHGVCVTLYIGKPLVMEQVYKNIPPPITRTTNRRDGNASGSNWQWWNSMKQFLSGGWFSDTKNIILTICVIVLIIIILGVAIYFLPWIKIVLSCCCSQKKEHKKQSEMKQTEQNK